MISSACIYNSNINKNIKRSSNEDDEDYEHVDTTLTSNETNELIISSSCNETTTTTTTPISTCNAKSNVMSSVHSTSCKNLLSKFKGSKLNLLGKQPQPESGVDVNKRNDADEDEIFNDVNENMSDDNIDDVKNDGSILLFRSINNLDTNFESATGNTNNNNQNLQIAKVGSYADLRLNQISMSNCFISSSTNSNSNKYLDSYNTNSNETYKLLTLNSYLTNNSSNNEHNSKHYIPNSYTISTSPNSFTYYTRSRSRSSSTSSSDSSSSSSSIEFSSTNNNNKKQMRRHNTNIDANPTLSSSSFASLFARDDNFKKQKNNKKKIKLSNNNHPNINSLNANTNHHQVILIKSNDVVSNIENRSNVNIAKSKLKYLQQKINKKISIRKSNNIYLTNIDSNNNTIDLINKSQLCPTKSSQLINCNNMSNNNENKIYKLSKKSRISKKFTKLNNETNLSKSHVVGSLSNFSTNTSNSLNFNKKLKCCLIGDPFIGKSTLLFLFLKRIFQPEYQPTIVDDYEVKVNHNGESYLLNLFDTAGQEDWDTLRIMAYPDTDVIILCFSVVRPDSCENIVNKWIPELNKFIPKALIVLVGTQIDLRDNNKAVLNDNADLNRSHNRHITTKEGEELRQRIKAFRYVECSAFTQVNIKEVFDTCIEAVVDSDKENSSQCCFESLFVTFRNSLRRRFNLRLGSSSSSSASSSPSSSKNLKKLKKKSK